MSSTHHWFKAKLREMPLDDCLEVLGNNQVGRIAFNDPSGPVVLPVNYSVTNGAILIATATGSSLHSYVPGSLVAFEVDDVDEFNEDGASVLVRGRAAIVPTEGFSDDERPYTWPEGPREVLLHIVPTQITGRRLFPA
ncbi:pyridoxamine 5'-phosphate oxidase family protein [Aeromicrobium terrae]|uniref:Pyridoxamine 5'-phosphate oxidase family protein n=1 Tax=Aeromicrobium terrae TaxID=2498846 RepID=A0A5C8NDC9_9ACTN|nr:pyridoxamine 5'-phosphate oxidase family protein [Aeromicrobium terrae]TXL57512.1 pyridoxamine 5'-phosphate oxidase family protein [Aeromicrobium terrae]